METPTLERTFRGHKSAVTSVSFHPNMQQLASGSNDSSVMIWNFRPQLRAFRYVGHKGPVYDVAFSPQGDVLASASQDRTVRLWTPSVKGASVTIKAHAGAVRSVSFSASGKELLTASDDMAIKVWSLPTRRFQCSLTGHSNWVRCARFSMDTHTIASASDDKTVKLWDTSHRVCLATFYEHAGGVNTVQFHPQDGSNTIASCSTDRSVNVFDARAHRLVQHYRAAHDAGISSLDFDASGNYLVTASLDHTLKIWDVREGQLLYTLHGHDGGVHCAAYASDSKRIASGGADAFVLVWDADVDAMLQVDGVASQVVPVVDGANIHRPTHAAAAGTSESLQPVAGRAKSPARAASLAAGVAGAALSSMSPPPTPTLKSQHPRPSVGSLAPSSGSSPHAVAMATSRTSAGAARSSHVVVDPTIAIATHTDNGNGDRAVDGTATGGSGSDTAMAATLQHIVGQLEIITRTLSVLEERISLNEDRITDVSKMQKELLQRQRQQQQQQQQQQHRRES